MINKAGGTYELKNGQVVCLELPTIDGAPETPPDMSGDNTGGQQEGIMAMIVQKEGVQI